MSGLTREQRRALMALPTMTVGGTVVVARSQVFTALAAAPSDDDLGAAWHEAEEALPEGAALVVRYQPWNGYTTVSAAPVERPEPPFVARASGPTPAAALLALAARLREAT